MRKLNHLAITAFLILLISPKIHGQQALPRYTYFDFKGSKGMDAIDKSGPARVVRFNGRSGINATSIRSFFRLKNHTLNNTRGTLTLWFLSLEDLGSYDPKPGMSKSNKFFYTYPFLSDNANPQDYDNGDFKLIWSPRWHPSLSALFAKGSFYEDAFNLPHRAYVSVSHMKIKKNIWYQVCLTWDYDADTYNMYINGILVGREDQFNKERFHRDPIGNSLYTGNPALCISTTKFYDKILTPKEVYQNFRTETTNYDQRLEHELVNMYNGTGLGKFTWKPDLQWQKKLSLSLKQAADLDSFYIQGHPIAVNITSDGMLVETINKKMNVAVLDSQVYVWSGKPFEGDLYVEYEFKTLRPGGLSLLMVQASGMNREDFMADYPLRTSGRMTAVYGEDIRNYHWEYYREMSDMRNDVANSALVKNPFAYPLSFNALTAPLNRDQWHKLQFLQIGNHLIGAIDGIKMVEFADDGFTNNGPVYNFGRIAIRCMLHTKMLFRNLKVYNRSSINVTQVLK